MIDNNIFTLNNEILHVCYDLWMFLWRANTKILLTFKKRKRRLVTLINQSINYCLTYDLYDDKNTQSIDVVNQIMCCIIRFHRIISDLLRKKLILMISGVNH